ncbi:MAG: hypothetical protein AB7V42_09735 [Thermoleophilia bacterium]
MAGVIAVAVTAGGAAVAQRYTTADDVFRDNPIQVGGVPSRQERTAIPGTSRLVTGVPVPDVGRVRIYMADGTRDGLCLAARLPSGEWLPLAGCWPRRDDPGERENLAQTGFDYRQETIYRGSDPVGQIVYGIVTREHAAEAVRVVDRLSGATSPTRAKGVFAFAVPAGQVDVAPVAYDAAGRIVSPRSGDLRRKSSR